jgi:hypothetical protein
MNRGVQLEMVSRNWQLAGAADVVSSAYPSRIPIATDPVNAALASGGQANQIIDLRGGIGPGAVIPKQAIIVFVASGAADENAFGVKLISWRRIKGLGAGQVPQNDLWIPTVLWEFATIIGTGVGVDNTLVDSTHKFVDTITLPATSQSAISGNDGANNTTLGSTVVYSPTNNLIAWIESELYGAEKIEFIYANSAGNPAVNALVALL